MDGCEVGWELGEDGCDVGWDEGCAEGAGVGSQPYVGVALGTEVGSGVG